MSQSPEFFPWLHQAKEKWSRPDLYNRINAAASCNNQVATMQPQKC